MSRRMRTAAAIFGLSLGACGTGFALGPAPDLGAVYDDAPKATVVAEKIGDSQKREALQREIEGLAQSLTRMGFDTWVNRLCSSGDRVFALDVGDGCADHAGKRCARLMVQDGNTAHAQNFRPTVWERTYPSPVLIVVIDGKAETLVESESIQDFYSKTQQLGFIERQIRYYESTLGMSKPAPPKIVDLTDTACKER